MKSKYPAYQIDWVDSSAPPGWYEIDDTDCDPLVIHSVGYLMAKTDKGVVITTSVSSYSGKAMDPLTIPRCAILKMKRIKGL